MVFKTCFNAYFALSFQINDHHIFPSASEGQWLICNDGQAGQEEGYPGMEAHRSHSGTKEIYLKKQ